MQSRLPCSAPCKRSIFIHARSPTLHNFMLTTRAMHSLLVAAIPFPVWTDQRRMLRIDITGDTNCVEFLLLQRPALEDALRQLFLLGCLDEDGALLPLGRRLAKLPLEPALGRLLVAADELGCLQDALSLCSMLSAESIFSGNKSVARHSQNALLYSLFWGSISQLVFVVHCVLICYYLMKIKSKKVLSARSRSCGQGVPCVRSDFMPLKEWTTLHARIRHTYYANKPCLSQSMSPHSWSSDRWVLSSIAPMLRRFAQSLSLLWKQGSRAIGAG